MEVKGINGEILEVGDKVIYTKYNDDIIYQGKVVNISPKNIFLDGRSPWGSDASTVRTRMETARATYRIIKLN